MRVSGGVGMMGAMTSQPPLPIAPVVGVRIGEVVDLVEDATGGRVYIRGEVSFAWDEGDATGRRVAATQLARIKAATGVAIADGFGITRETLRAWRRALEAEGTAGLVADTRGPKGPSKLTGPVIAQVNRLRREKETRLAIATAVGISTDTVRRALALTPTQGEPADTAVLPAGDEIAEDAVVVGEATGDDDAAAADDVGVVVGALAAGEDRTAGDEAEGAVGLPVLALPVPRGAERARAGRDGPAGPVFTACGSAPWEACSPPCPGSRTPGCWAARGRCSRWSPRGSTDW